VSLTPDEVAIKLAEIDLEKTKIENAESVIDLRCGFCNSRMSYNGDDKEVALAVIDKFYEIHDPCGQS